MKIVVKDQPQLLTETAFYEISPKDPEAAAKASALLAGGQFPRLALSDLLRKYNQAIGNDALALQNIEKLAQADSRCVITGQQLGFMGGPAYTILKGISCLLLARQTNAVPIFWLATEDHDINEIDHSYLLDDAGNLKKYKLAFSKRGQAVEDLRLELDHFKTIDDFFQAIGTPAFVGSLPKEPGSYAKWMAQFLVQMFAGTGMVFVEPYLLRELAVAFFKKEAVESDAMLQILQERSHQLAETGVTPPILFSQGTNLFLKVKDQRKKLIRKDGLLTAGDRTFSESEILHMIEQEPQRLSTNVAARPVLQSLLFPTLAYVAGPSELKYFQQLGTYFHAHGIAMPWIVPRLSATVLTPRAQKLLNEAQLEPWNIPSRKYHYLSNLISPRSRLQERVLNWWQFQRECRENLIGQFIAQANWQTEGHLYCYVE